MRFSALKAVAIITLVAGAIGFSRYSASENKLADIAPNLLPLSAEQTLVEPVDNFATHATKKRFGIYITPDTSPIEGDRFTGYHTGVDAEFTDTVGEVPVRAIADGTVVAQTWAKGYGGVAVIRHVINGQPIFAVYGHLDPASFDQSLSIIKAGQTIGVLGDGHSHETDGVRKHLHFALYRGEKIDYRGYVPTESELELWLDPLIFF
jgi:murein DD-endopeptidase MepM/ murein hydrolase activator NlpD